MSSILPIMAVATTLNAGAVVSKGEDPTTTLLSSAVFTLVLEIISDTVDPSLGSAFAGVFLLGTFLVHASFFTDIVGYVTTPKDSKG